MRKIKFIGAGLFLALSVLFLGLAPTKASAQYDGINNGFDSNGIMFRNNQFDSSFNPTFRDRFSNRFNRAVTFPRTVYLVDVGNSANQVNIINATTGGTTNAARITVSTQAYNRAINDLDTVGIMSVRVNSANGIVTFSSPIDMFTARIIAISFM